MPAIFVTSDEHYGHRAANVLNQRPFSSVDEGTHEMIVRHNKKVPVDGRTFHDGDFFLGPRTDGQMAEILRQLNGEHILVLGNHDRASITQSNGWSYQREYLDAGFLAVVDHATLTLPQVSPKFNGGAPARRVLLSHFPYTADHSTPPRFTQFRLRDEGSWLVHGHVHGLYTVRDRGVNVGVDVWDFTPVQDHEIARLIHDIETGNREEF